MEIKEFLKAKNDMENEISYAIQSAMSTFTEATGYSPRSISVDMFEVQEIGEERPRSYVKGVRAGMDL